MVYIFFFYLKIKKYQDFLAPFGYIFNHMQGHAIRDLVVRCVQQMVFARASSIKSGWRAIMSVFQQAAKEDNGKKKRKQEKETCFTILSND